MHSLLSSVKKYVYNPNHPVGRDVDPVQQSMQCMQQKLARMTELSEVLANRRVTAAYFDEVSTLDCDDASRPAYRNCIQLTEKIVRGHGLRRLWRLFAEREHLYRWIEVTPSIAQRFVQYVSDMQHELHSLIGEVGDTMWSLPHGMYTCIDNIFHIDHVWGTIALERSNGQFLSLLRTDEPYGVRPQRERDAIFTHLVLVQPHMPVEF